ncbi:hypothetical protein A2454_02805 [Candidatus Peribacteria bacterium RIFOXYC2_FULL_55_14]|nr:MAG: Polysaccharide deacetylase [Candidatus Peribacteria bacterium GW2011_GWB1_54_5]OGJ71103.1 MAG: hypothetical protein A2198_01185 [Candidatus Peribacteria bacterium RIFOXYA1_FULL_56_14]OGJ73737.1 MAG: hypothetical protein A2384_04130 [Candidatus Peribacteria bacterium RIFOXYB1_FULL_54_35]OGJ74865.1 MAG: hypothetical protein A2217_02600 [Candidatus Peribacteria bacterium RIFOXYA2_FULL_55_28]OGJ77153.1 MAG: hypothetical protein A2327_05705 [Candidatus Peribacteria bacterium RIFOXYB2_FULL_54
MTVSDSIRLQGDIDRAIAIDAFPRTAVLTCDIEPDYGARTGTAALLEEEQPLNDVLAFCAAQKLPLSCFVVTSLLQGNKGGICVLRAANLDVHAHSHTHNTQQYRVSSAEEMQKAQDVFSAFFGRPSLGYRAPQGVLYPGDIQALSGAGYAFDSSVFPSRRRGLFDYRALPTEPWMWRGGVLELPFAALAHSRRRVTVSMLKLRGRRFWQRQLREPAHWPHVFVIDSHLHDFFTPGNFHHLPLAYRLAYGRRKEQGFALLSWLVELLKGQGYRFVDMTSLCRELRARK